jgi:CubicO group peptidase (beta-lactamase class C family)
MNRRNMLKTAGATMIASQMPQAAMTDANAATANWNRAKLDDAAKLMQGWIGDGRVQGASILVTQGANRTFARNFGTTTGTDPVFLLASITKPMTAAAVMTLVDAGKLSLDDKVTKFFPSFTGEGREAITIRHCLTHSSGLPDMLADDEMLREKQAPLTRYRDGALKAPLKFAPGTSYSYSSMGILLASYITEQISGTPFAQYMEEKIYQPLGMTKTTLGLRGRDKASTVASQPAPAMTEAGKRSWVNWNWNSDYWRGLGAPWGGALGSASDIARFYDEFLFQRGKILKPQTETLMINNQSPPGVSPQGLGFCLVPRIGSPANSPRTFGHNGSTGTLSWADPDTGTICIVLTTLYEASVRPHPIRLVSDIVAQAVIKA